jgi:hypothetical protein
MRWGGDGAKQRWQRSKGREEKEKKEKQERNHTTQVTVTSRISICIDICTNIKCSGRGKERWRRRRDRREKRSKGLRESGRACCWGEEKEREGEGKMRVFVILEEKVFNQ